MPRLPSHFWYAIVAFTIFAIYQVLILLSIYIFARSKFVHIHFFAQWRQQDGK